MFSSVGCRNALCRGLRTSTTHVSHPWSRAQVVAPSSRALSYRSHQRRSSSSSSSKPSNTPQGSRVVTQQQDASGSRASDRTQFDGEKRSGARLNRRKARDGGTGALPRAREEFLKRLPCVPATTHVHPADIAISDFFSLHRPISVTSSVPTAASGSSFDSIFKPASEAVHRSEVISTLSSAVSTLEGHQQAQQARSYDNATDREFRAAIESVSSSSAEDPQGTVTHLDGHQDSPGFELFGQLLSERYRPFTPPPVPVPVKDVAGKKSSTFAYLVESASASATLKKSYSTVLTILEATHPNGSKTYTARTSPIVAQEISSTETEVVPSGFLDRMWQRQQRWNEYYRRRRSEGEGEGEGQGDMWAISVKRQRRLKMKKHKYKKLMRKTRNLRRRMEKN